MGTEEIYYNLYFVKNPIIERGVKILMVTTPYSLLFIIGCY